MDWETMRGARYYTIWDINSLSVGSSFEVLHNLEFCSSPQQGERNVEKEVKLTQCIRNGLISAPAPS